MTAREKIEAAKNQTASAIYSAALEDVEIERRAGFETGAFCPRANRSFAKALDEMIDQQATTEVAISLDIARSGSAYWMLELATIPHDLDDAVPSHVDIRVSDHRSRAGAYSHDGRTENYTRPDFELGRGASPAAVQWTAAAALHHIAVILNDPGPSPLDGSRAIS